MSTPPDDYLERREALAAQIARQRTDLAQAFGQLEKPIRYAEYGMRGFGFLRANPWIFVAFPAALKLVGVLTGKKKASPPPSEQKPTSRRHIVHRTISHGWNLFQLYRRVRSYLP